MLRFLGRRLLQLIPTLFFVSVIIFGLQQLLPGDPALAMAGEERDPAVLEQIRKQYRLDQPLTVQYLYWVGGVLSGNLGESMRLKEPVLTLIKQKFPDAIHIDPVTNPFSLNLFEPGLLGDTKAVNRQLDTFRYLFEASGEPLTRRMRTAFDKRRFLMSDWADYLVGRAAPLERRAA